MAPASIPLSRWIMRATSLSATLIAGPRLVQRRKLVADRRRGEHRLCSTLRGGPWHPVDTRALLVLGDRPSAGGSHSRQALRAVTSHPGQHHSHRPRSRGAGEAGEQHVSRGTVIADDRVGVESQAAGRFELQVRPIGREPDARRKLLAVVRQAYGKRELPVQPAHQPGDEARSHVLDHQDRDSVVGRESPDDFRQRPRSTCRGADADHFAARPCGGTSRARMTIRGWQIAGGRLAHCAPTRRLTASSSACWSNSSLTM